MYMGLSVTIGLPYNLVLGCDGYYFVAKPYFHLSSGIVHPGQQQPIYPAIRPQIPLPWTLIPGWPTMQCLCSLPDIAASAMNLWHLIYLQYSDFLTYMPSRMPTPCGHTEACGTIAAANANIHSSASIADFFNSFERRKIGEIRTRPTHFQTTGDSKLTQRDYKDSDGSLIAPYKLYDRLTEGTLVLVTVSLVTYIMTDQETDKGVYHVLVDRLKILDRGDGEP
ncbi:hypothetical protein B0H13DRAFT_2282515 [Mycena leptocephala]|nr:hypothetical protein B0H13DRAFT_2282515 [Mycena leptocephala]